MELRKLKEDGLGTHTNTDVVTATIKSKIQLGTYKDFESEDLGVLET